MMVIGDLTLRDVTWIDVHSITYVRFIRQSDEPRDLLCIWFYIVFGHGKDLVIVCVQWTGILLVEKLLRNEQFNLGAYRNNKREGGIVSDISSRSTQWQRKVNQTTWIWILRGDGVRNHIANNVHWIYTRELYHFPLCWLQFNNRKYIGCVVRAFIENIFVCIDFFFSLFVSRWT